MIDRGALQPVDDWVVLIWNQWGCIIFAMNVRSKPSWEVDTPLKKCGGRGFWVESEGITSWYGVVVSASLHWILEEVGTRDIYYSIPFGVSSRSRATRHHLPPPKLMSWTERETVMYCTYVCILKNVNTGYKWPRGVNLYNNCSLWHDFSRRGRGKDD